MPLSSQTIELDCPPLAPRPDTYIAAVIEGTGLPLREPVSKSFGNWIWDYSDIPATVWKAANPKIKRRITKLYNNGSIRYGSW